MTGRKLAALMGLNPGDVTRTIQDLEDARVLHRTYTRPPRLWFLPEAALVAPGFRVPEDMRARLLAEIEAMQPAAPDEEHSGQKLLAIETTEEGLAIDQLQASAELALERDRERLERENEALRGELAAIRAQLQRATPRRTPQDDRAHVEQRMREAGMSAAEIDASRQVPADRLRSAFASLFLPQVGETPISLLPSEGGPAQIGETPISRAFSATIAPEPSFQGVSVQIGKSPISPELTERHRGRIGVSPISQNSPSETVAEIGDLPTHTVKPFTVPRGEKSQQGTVKDRAAKSSPETWQRPAVADPELMELCRELVGEEAWTRTDAKGKGNWGSLWCDVLRSSPVAPLACFEAIGFTRDAIARGAVSGSVGAYLYGTFRNLHREKLRAWRRQHGKEEQPRRVTSAAKAKKKGAPATKKPKRAKES